LNPIPSQTDVFIVGGGPAGLVAAIAARRQGLRVVVADHAHPGADKACGEGLMPDALAVLKRLSVELPRDSALPFHGIRFLDRGLSANAPFSNGTGLGIRRTTLHRILAEHALECGVTLLWGSPVNSFEPDSVDAGGRRIGYRYLIGADGESSSVRRYAGLDAHTGETRRYGFRRHYSVEPWSDCVDVHWAPGAQICVTPVGPRLVCVALLSRDAGLRLKTALALFPELSARIGQAEPASAERGAVSAQRRLRRVCNERVALAGDASGPVDSITGEGLCLAFRQAEALADALASSDLPAYQAAHERIRRGPAFMSRLLLLLDRHPAVRRRSIAALAARPPIFARMLAAHVGDVTPARLTSAALSLGWGLLTA
jgi:menaquinone-9 beta-reductase